MATAGLHTIVIPTKSPFIKTTRIGNRFPEALAILRAVFVRNPMPARVKFGASDDESYPEVNIGVQPNKQAQPYQQPPAPQQQHGQPSQMPQLSPQPIQQPGIAVGPPPAAVPQQLQQPFVAQQPPQQLPMNLLPHQPHVVLQQPQFIWQVPAAPIPGNPGFAVQNWQTQPMIFRSEAKTNPSRLPNCKPISSSSFSSMERLIGKRRQSPRFVPRYLLKRSKTYLMPPNLYEPFNLVTSAARCSMRFLKMKLTYSTLSSRTCR